MNLIELPWFIRREIIEFVIETHPEYRFVNKEWLGYVARRHGKLAFRFDEPDTKPISPVENHIEEIEFGRAHDIDWELVSRCKNIKRVSAWFNEFISRQGYEIFKTKLLQIPTLTSLTLSGNGIRQLDVIYILNNQRYHLKSFCMNLSYYNFGDMGELKSSNITFLWFYNVKSSINFKAISRVMPKLKILCLGFHKDFSTSTELEFVKCTSLIELNLSVSPYSDGVAHFDLSKFPNLYKLVIGMGLVPNKEFRNPDIECMQIQGSAEYLRSVISLPFNRLRELTLWVRNDVITNDVLNLLERCLSLSSLKTLHLTMRLESGYLDYLPVGSDTLDTLTLFNLPITSHLLTCLARNFKLRRLELHSCEFKVVNPPGDLNLDYLHYVVVSYRGELDDTIESYLNSDTCKNLRSIKFKRYKHH